MNFNSKKIVRWSADNPPEVECAYRKGFLLGAHLASSTKNTDVFGLYAAFANVAHAIDQYDHSWDNRPIHNNKPDNERIVGNNLGVIVTAEN